MKLQTRPNALIRARGALADAPGGAFGELATADLTPRYYNLVKAGVVFGLGVLGISCTAFQGGAAGTPIFGINNPIGSGVDLVMLQARVGVRDTGTSAGSVDFSFYAGRQGSVAVTGTQTQATNQYTQLAQGSAAYCMVNVGNNGAVASSLIAPSISVGKVTTTATVNMGLCLDDIGGAIVVSPGVYLAFGNAANQGAAATDATLIWAELPA